MKTTQEIDNPDERSMPLPIAYWIILTFGISSLIGVGGFLCGSLLTKPNRQKVQSQISNITNEYNQLLNRYNSTNKDLNDVLIEVQKLTKLNNEYKDQIKYKKYDDMFVLDIYSIYSEFHLLYYLGAYFNEVTLGYMTNEIGSMKMAHLKGEINQDTVFPKKRFSDEIDTDVCALYVNDICREQKKLLDRLMYISTPDNDESRKIHDDLYSVIEMGSNTFHLMYKLLVFKDESETPKISDSFENYKQASLKFDKDFLQYLHKYSNISIPELKYKIYHKRNY